MVGHIPLDEKGNPVDAGGGRLDPSAYQPPQEVIDLFARCQQDYQTAWRLQHRPFDDFDGVSLLQRARMDQQTFAAYVGAEWVPQHKRWRWQGRKNTARNKILGILSHLIAGMLYPYVAAFNEEDEEDKLAARVMRILMEHHLKKARYDLNFLFMVCSALVNPAAFVEVRFIQAFQRIRQRMKDGKIKLENAVDELLSGLNLNIIPVDQILLADFYTFDIQRQPYVIKVRRIPWDEARKIYAKKHFTEDGKDIFDYVQAGKTRVVLAGQEKQTLYNIDWTEADRDYVQELTFYYRPEDMELTWVGGVFMGSQKDVWNTNPFSHRRLSLIKDEWISIPVYPFAKSGFEPLDPSGRFAYYKSASFKEYWDDNWHNTMAKLLHDGTYLDVIKPNFISGITKVDSTVMIPGATIGMPAGATVTPYSLGPNLQGVARALQQSEQDMSESTQDKVMTGITTPNVTATQSAIAVQQAKVFLGIFGLMISDLIRQVGELVVDEIIQHTTIGELDATVPESLRMKFKTILIKNKESGKELTNRIVFSDKGMGEEPSQEDIMNRVWDLNEQAGGEKSDQRIYEVNPYKFARLKYSIYIDPDKIIDRSMGMDKERKKLAFNMLTDPRVAPFTDPKAVAEKLVIEEFSEGDPDEFKAKENQQDLLNGMMMPGGSSMTPQLQQAGAVGLPKQQPALNQ